MSSRLSVIFYIILCFEIGIVLTALPWVPHGFLGLSDWGNNYFLLLASRKVGFGIQRFIASGWVRGAISGIGILNLGMGVWELVNFRTTVRALDAGIATVKSSPPKTETNSTNAAHPAHTDPLSDYPRRNHGNNDAPQS
jgi:hypothetical protein